MADLDHCAAFENGWHGGPPTSMESSRFRRPRSRGATLVDTAITSCGSISRQLARFAVKLRRAISSSSMQPIDVKPAHSRPRSKPPRPENVERNFKLEVFILIL